MKITELNRNKEEVKKLALELKELVDRISDGNADIKDEVYATELSNKLMNVYGIKFEIAQEGYIKLTHECPTEDEDCFECPSEVCDYSENWDCVIEVAPNWKEGYGILHDYAWDHIPEDLRPEVDRALKKVGL